jgi:predicted NBD/HSP70 family sugar kinase
MTIEQPVNQKNIKIGNIIRICEHIFANGPVSRGELASACGLSLMTAGKIADLLKKNGIVSEKKEEESLVGRKAGFLSTAEHRRILVLDLSKNDFEMQSMRVDGQCIDRKTLSYKKEMSYQENLEHALFQFAKVYSPLFKDCLGLGVLAPGPYDPEKDIVINKRFPELMSLPVKKTIEDHFPGISITIDEDVKFAARYAVSQVHDFSHKTVFYAYIGDGAGGAVVSHGSVPQTAYSYASDFGQLTVGNGATAESFVSMEALRKLFPDMDFSNSSLALKNLESDPQFKKYVNRAMEVLVWCFQSVMWLIDPDEILIDSNHLSKIPGFLTELSERFRQAAGKERGEQIPKLTILEISENAKYYGACNEVRRAFLRTIA